MKNVWKNSVEISAERDFRRESIRHGPDTAVEELGPITRANRPYDRPASIRP